MHEEQVERLFSYFKQYFNQDEFRLIISRAAWSRSFDVADYRVFNHMLPTLAVIQDVSIVRDILSRATSVDELCQQFYFKHLELISRPPTTLAPAMPIDDDEESLLDDEEPLLKRRRGPTWRNWQSIEANAAIAGFMHNVLDFITHHTNQVLNANDYVFWPVPITKEPNSHKYEIGISDSTRHGTKYQLRANGFLVKKCYGHDGQVTMHRLIAAVRLSAEESNLLFFAKAVHRNRLWNEITVEEDYYTMLDKEGFDRHFISGLSRTFVARMSVNHFLKDEVIISSMGLQMPGISDDLKGQMQVLTSDPQAIENSTAPCVAQSASPHEITQLPRDAIAPNPTINPVIEDLVGESEVSIFSINPERTIGLGNMVLSGRHGLFGSSLISFLDDDTLDREERNLGALEDGY